MLDAFQHQLTCVLLSVHGESEGPSCSTCESGRGDAGTLVQAGILREAHRRRYAVGHRPDVGQRVLDPPPLSPTLLLEYHTVSR